MVMVVSLFFVLAAAEVVWASNQTKDNTPGFINPISHAFTVILMLYLHIHLVCLCRVHRFNARNLMNIHVYRNNLGYLIEFNGSE